MTTTNPTRSLEESLLEEVRRLKHENAAEYGFNIRAIGEAARRHQAEHPERVVSRENQKEAEQVGDGDA